MQIRHDIQNNIPLVTSSAVAATSSDNTAMTFPSGSTGYDTLGFDAVNFFIISGTLADADATFTVEISEADTTNGSYTAVADADLIALESTVAFAFGDDNIVRQIGVKPRKRYLRVVVTPANNTSAAAFTVVVNGVKQFFGTV
jgi:hypothetical protein